MTAKDLMTTNLITVKADDPVSEVGKLLNEKRINGLPVVNDYNNMLGIITITDLLKILYTLFKKMDLNRDDNISNIKNLFKNKKIKEFMTKKYISVEENSTLSEIMEIMFDQNIHTIPVLKNDKLVGIIGKHDIEHVFFA